MKNDGILCVERIVLESLSQKNRTVNELALETNLSFNLVSNILFGLKSKNIINFNGSKYSINKSLQKNWLNKINEKNYVKEEVKELFSSLVNQYFDEEKNIRSRNLKMKKVWMTEKEDKIFQILVGNLKTFLDNVNENRVKEGVIHSMAKQKVVIWGYCGYSEILNGLLKAV